MLIRNIQNAEVFSMDQMLMETGLAPRHEQTGTVVTVTNSVPAMQTNKTSVASGETNRKPVVVSAKTNQTVPKYQIVDSGKNIDGSAGKTQVTPAEKTEKMNPNTPSTHIDQDALVNEDFSINIFEKNAVIQLKTIRGDIGYLKDQSNPKDGFFLFHNGRSGGEVFFEVYDPNGKMTKTLIYRIKPLNFKSDTKQIVRMTNIIRNPGIGEQTNTEIPDTGTNAGFTMSEFVLKSIENLPAAQQIRTLYQNIDAPEMRVQERTADREALRWKLVDILIDQTLFTEAMSNINLITDQYKKNYYTARLQQKQRNNKQAENNYTYAMNGDAKTKKDSILELENLLLKEGDVSAGAVQKVSAETAAFRSSDPDFYAKSMINIARLYEFIGKVYDAQAIYESILSGAYSPANKKSAQKYYDELKKNFLDYQ